MFQRGWTLPREEMVTSCQRSQGLRWPEGEGEVVNSVKGLRESHKEEHKSFPIDLEEVFADF